MTAVLVVVVKCLVAITRLQSFYRKLTFMFRGAGPCEVRFVSPSPSIEIRCRQPAVNNINLKFLHPPIRAGSNVELILHVYGVLKERLNRFGYTQKRLYTRSECVLRRHQPHGFLLGALCFSLADVCTYWLDLCER
jgi:hypothetical protein